MADESISFLSLARQRSPYGTSAIGNKACYTVCSAKMPCGIYRNEQCMCDAACASPKPSHLWWHIAAALAADTALPASRSAWHNDQLADFVAHPAVNPSYINLYRGKNVHNGNSTSGAVG